MGTESRPVLATATQSVTRSAGAAEGRTSVRGQGHGAGLRRVCRPPTVPRGPPWERCGGRPVAPLSLAALHVPTVEGRASEVWKLPTRWVLGAGPAAAARRPGAGSARGSQTTSLLLTAGCPAWGWTGAQGPCPGPWQVVAQAGPPREPVSPAPAPRTRPRRAWSMRKQRVRPDAGARGRTCPASPAPRPSLASCRRASGRDGPPAALRLRCPRAEHSCNTFL